MTRGVGGSTAKAELAKLSDRLGHCQPVPVERFSERLDGLRARMKAAGIDAVWLNAGTNLTYYTGLRWRASERLVGALVTADGGLTYLGPAFETGTLEAFMTLTAPLAVWEEHESPYDLLAGLDGAAGRLGLDPTTPLVTAHAILAAHRGESADASDLILAARRTKDAEEIALMQATKDATLEVHAAAARILRAGMTTGEVTEFIHAAHKAVGAPGGSTFCIVLFGPDTAFPHGVANPKTLDEGDMVLIDTGCAIHGYQSDITRSYVFGEPTDRQREVWEAEKACQLAAFQAARPGIACSAVDAAARTEAERRGFGPGYTLPGIPHRTGHGIGLDIHEGPYLVGGDDTPLEAGMCFSNEPMICVPGEFGIRLEDHFYMTGTGPRWFTEPSKSIDDPFG
ncbi:Xaa-Pro peptidase family protein [Maricaulis sp.]|uniref:M24 family metallopeptidase n=1 Tax=Maricaulis sp. TaxID=1486257 RepID=UPI00344B1021